MLINTLSRDLLSCTSGSSSLRLFASCQALKSTHFQRTFSSSYYVRDVLLDEGHAKAAHHLVADDTPVQPHLLGGVGLPGVSSSKTTSLGHKVSTIRAKSMPSWKLRAIPGCALGKSGGSGFLEVYANCIPMMSAHAMKLFLPKSPHSVITGA